MKDDHPFGAPTARAHDLAGGNRRACAALHHRVSSGGMIAELDSVALTVNLPKHGLTAGDAGAVVHVYKGGKRFLVEFTTFDGSTVAVTKVADVQIRPLSRNESTMPGGSSRQCVDAGSLGRPAKEPALEREGTVGRNRVKDTKNRLGNGMTNFRPDKPVQTH